MSGLIRTLCDSGTIHEGTRRSADHRGSIHASPTARGSSRKLVDRFRDDLGCVDRDEQIVIRQHVPVEVQVDADLKHCERRSLVRSKARWER